MNGLLDIFKALGDETRLRMLRAVGIAELSVAELVGILKLPQSSVSRHLKPLRDAGLLEARREGTSVYYRRGSAFDDEALARFLNEKLETLRGAGRDRVAVEHALEQRRKESKRFFDEIAGRYSTLTEPGGGWRALAAALAAGFAGQSVADIGCGEGDLTLLLARFVQQVSAVDLSAPMLRVVQERAAEAGLSRRVTVAKGDIESIPLKPGSMDAIFVSQVLHHAARPEKALAEAARVLKSGGRLVLLDLARHGQEWVRTEWADQWLGFDHSELRRGLQAAGFTVDALETLPGTPPELAVLLAVARKKDVT